MNQRITLTDDANDWELTIVFTDEGVFADIFDAYGEDVDSIPFAASNTYEELHLDKPSWLGAS